MATETAVYESKVVEISDPAQWEIEKHSTLRQGMRERNFIDYGGLTIGRVGANVILGDGGWVEFPIACKSEAAAVMEFQRLTSGIDDKKTIVELLPGVELPVEIATAWVK